MFLQQRIETVLINNKINNNGKDLNDISKCPFHNGTMKKNNVAGGTQNSDWWPDQLRVDLLRQHSSLSDLWIKTLTMPKLLKTLILKR
jgi:catalase-peroxidase